MGKAVKWYQHVIFQEAALFVGMFFLTIIHEWAKLDTVGEFVRVLIYFMILYAQVQVHRFYVLPFLFSKRYGLYTIITAPSLIAGGIILYIASYYWLDPNFFHKVTMIRSIIYFVVMYFITIVIMIFFMLMQQYYNEVQKRNHDQLLISEINLKFLQAQLNPHFFFNMFNNLHGVSLTDPKRVPDLIVRLSKLMRYPLENGSKSVVKLSEEIDFIKNYISMEQERGGKRCKISLESPDYYEELDNYYIPPLIMTTIVENAFKHSAGTKSNWFVDVAISFDRGDLFLEVSNSIGQSQTGSASTGIGLSMIRERLALLYQNRHSFHITQSQQSFTASLTIKLLTA